MTAKVIYYFRNTGYGAPMVEAGLPVGPPAETSGKLMGEKTANEIEVKSLKTNKMAKSLI